MRWPWASEGTSAFLKRAPILYLLLGLIMAIPAMLLNGPLPDPVLKTIDAILIGYLALGILAGICFLLLKALVPWLQNRRVSPVYRIGMTAAAAAVVGYGIAGRTWNAIPLAVILCLVALLVHISSKNARDEADQDSDWERAEEEFWSRYNNTGAYFSEDGEQVAKPEDAADPLAVLGLDAGASREEIRSAYRAICLACHPDTNGGRGDPARFRSATDAYHALTS